MDNMARKSTAEYIDEILHDWVEEDPFTFYKVGCLEGDLHRGNESKDWACFVVKGIVYTFKLSTTSDLSPFAPQIFDSPAAIATLAMWAKRNGMRYIGQYDLKPANRLYNGGPYVDHKTVKVENDVNVPYLPGGTYEEYTMTVGTVRVYRQYLIGV